MTGEPAADRPGVDRRLAASLVTALALSVILLRILSTHAWDPLALVLLTPAGTSPTQSDNIGYDGRFTYHIAVNEFGDTTGLDEPNFRYQRILVPLLIKLLSLGNPTLVPWLMLLVNLAAAAASAWLLAGLLADRRAGPWWALVLFLSIGYLIAIRFDLLEPVAIFFLLAACRFHQAERPLPTALALALGALTKESVLVAAAVLALHELRQRDWRRAALFLASGLPYLAWSLYLANRFGVPAAAVEKSSLGLVPFAGFFGIDDRIAFWVVGIWCVFPAIGFGAWAVLDAARTRFQGWDGLAAGLVAAYALVIGALPAATWIDPLAVLRWGLGFLALLLVWLAGSHRRVLPYAAALWLPSGLVLALVPGML